ncbi:adaptor protein MecA [Anaeromicropila herbilytica]|uniref:Adapter protein MecA 2 n=1 Tax=Anaeromicropila herbilytica TaxID=2785025 RepID=A0A7R7EPU0_9FIRM|nr:adaptor protein MecA [Anaeromicropila herbilytica]BCN32831.1 adapter protein MecA 2 [Anaeromicropila herbilytica]
MKIEKLSENQIRCTLNKDDLVTRELRISELAYGTEKAKALFRDMMQQASYEFGFDAEDIPLMIEAIPVSTECLILVITKVEDPDELDTRFSKFSQGTDDDEDIFTEESDDASYADEILNCFDQLDNLLDDDSTDNFVPLEETLSQENQPSTEKKQPEKEPAKNTNLIKVYSFKALDDVITLSHTLVSSYNGDNTLYKNPVTSLYYLVISKSDHTPEEFNKICNILSEYGKSERTTYASPAFFKEHFEIIVNNKAIQILSNM